MQFTIYQGIVLTPFESHPGKKTRTELTVSAEDCKSFFSSIGSNYLVQRKDNRRNPTTCHGGADIQAFGSGQNESGKQPAKQNSLGEYTFQFVEKP